MFKIQCERCLSQDRANCNCGWTRDDLTFAEAMALDPSEVEVLDNVPANAPRWKLLAACLDGFTMSWFRTARFRRARPRRSRVQEMAEEHYESTRAGVDITEFVSAGMTRAIRAVCEWLRTSEAGHMIDHDLPGQVEREFLEPR